MYKLLVLIAGIGLSGIVLAGPSTFVEGAYVTGGENGQNGAGNQDGLEATGAYAFNELWYVGGIVGRYTRETGSGDIDNTYLAGNGGRFFKMSDNVDMFLEGAIWIGEQDNPGGTKTDPRALEGKVGVNGYLAEKFTLFGTISLVAGDLDTPPNDKLRDFVWSFGGAYAFTPKISLNLKVVEGSNGVNGQSDVARIGFRWTFK